jgi:hypothetical protein
MPERFTETLRAASEAGWSHAVQQLHPRISRVRISADLAYKALAAFSGTGCARGTDGSNPAPSRGESTRSTVFRLLKVGKVQ